jgi:[protein-PII] uridylyltransferase
VLDIVQFTDVERFFALNPDGGETFSRVLEDVVAGRSDVSVRLRRREQSVFHKRAASRFRPIVHCDNQASSRYTVLEINADDSLGLLYRISRTISLAGCDVDLVLISTEGHRAFDVFHITAGGAKLTVEAQEQLAQALQEMLEGGGQPPQNQTSTS